MSKFGVRRRVGSKSRASSGRSALACPVSAVDILESRRHFSGTWTALSNLAPSSVGTMILLSDGSVMAQQAGVTNVWYKLTPTIAGSYASGTWSTLASNSLQRLYDATQVLPDGRLFVLGGEYSGPSGTANWINSAEMYNPVSNTWSSIATYPESQYGDVPSAVLDNGTVLCGSLTSAKCYIYTPATNTWAQAGTKLYGDRSDEETWIKLGDGSILSYDIFGSAQRAQRYIPSTNTWVDAGLATGSLGTPGGAELGPGLLLPDGRALQVGGTSSNSIYVPSSNSWVAAPDTPNSLGANDAPGVMLPGGTVLYAAGDTSTSFNPPTYMFEFDPVANTTTTVSASGSPSLSGQPFTTRFLMLPNGQALFTQSSSRLYLYTGTGVPNDAWRPKISNIVANADGSFKISGLQLNGMSEGASYGDDSQMSSNYPIVKVTSSAGLIRYGRSFGWSSAGVQTGTNTVTTNFTMPAAFAAGAYLVSVSGAGISTAKDTLEIQIGAATTSSVTLQADPGDATKTQVLAGTNALGSFSNASFNQIIISGDNSGDTVILRASLPSVPVIVNGGTGNDRVVIESTAGLSNLTLNLGTGADTLALTVASYIATTRVSASNSLLLEVSNGGTATFLGTQVFGGLTTTAGTNLNLVALVTINGDSTVAGKATLSSSGTLAGTGNVTVVAGGDLEWTGGLMSGTGTTTIATGGTLNFTGAADAVLARGLVNSGVATITNGHTLYVNAGGAFNNAAAGTFNLTSSSSLSFSTPVSGTFLNAGTLNKTGGTSTLTLPVTNVGTINLNSGTYSDIGGLTQTGGTLNYNVTNGYTSPTATLFIGGGSIVANANLAGLSLTLGGSGSATGTFNVSQAIGTLSIAAGSVATLVTANRLLNVNSLVVNGLLDLTNGSMIVNYSGTNSPLASIMGKLAIGYASGSWAGTTGIRSSTAAADISHLTSLGYGEAGTLFNLAGAATATFQGTTVDATAVLVKYTYAGDTDLNGSVDGPDVANLLAGLNGGLTGWTNGDVNYDGTVTAADSALQMSALLGQGSPLGNGGGEDDGGGSGAPLVHAASAHLTLTTPAHNVIAGDRLPKFAVEVDDATGAMTSASSVVHMTVLSGPGALFGSVSAVARHGLATFSTTSLRMAGTYVLQFTDDGYDAAVTESFRVVAGKPTQLVFATLPQAVASGVSFATTVSLLDRYGNVAADSSSVAALDWSGTSRNGRSSGTRTATFADGTAAFSDVSIAAPGQYAISARAGRLRATSRLRVG